MKRSKSVLKQSFSFIIIMLMIAGPLNSKAWWSSGVRSGIKITLKDVNFSFDKDPSLAKQSPEKILSVRAENDKDFCFNIVTGSKKTKIEIPEQGPIGQLDDYAFWMESLVKSAHQVVFMAKRDKRNLNKEVNKKYCDIVSKKINPIINDYIRVCSKDMTTLRGLGNDRDILFKRYICLESNLNEFKEVLEEKTCESAVQNILTQNLKGSGKNYCSTLKEIYKEEAKEKKISCDASNKSLKNLSLFMKEFKERDGLVAKGKKDSFFNDELKKLNSTEKKEKRWGWLNEKLSDINTRLFSKSEKYYVAKEDAKSERDGDVTSAKYQNKIDSDAARKDSEENKNLILSQYERSKTDISDKYLIRKYNIDEKFGKINAKLEYQRPNNILVRGLSQITSRPMKFLARNLIVKPIHKLTLVSSVYPEKAIELSAAEILKEAKLGFNDTSAKAKLVKNSVVSGVKQGIAHTKYDPKILINNVKRAPFKVSYDVMSKAVRGVFNKEYAQRNKLFSQREELGQKYGFEVDKATRLQNEIPENYQTLMKIVDGLRHVKNPKARMRLFKDALDKSDFVLDENFTEIEVGEIINTFENAYSSNRQRLSPPPLPPRPDVKEVAEVQPTQSVSEPVSGPAPKLPPRPEVQATQVVSEPVEKVRVEVKTEPVIEEVAKVIPVAPAVPSAPAIVEVVQEVAVVPQEVQKESSVINVADEGETSLHEQLSQALKRRNNSMHGIVNNKEIEKKVKEAQAEKEAEQNDGKKTFQFQGVKVTITPEMENMINEERVRQEEELRQREANSENQGSGASDDEWE